MVTSLRRAFTIVELLVVIAIIGILVALGLFIAGKVSGVGKQRVTEQTLRILDSALATYIAAQGANPPALVEDPRYLQPANSSQRMDPLIPIIDGRNATSGAGNETINSVGLFLLQLKDVPECRSKIEQIDPKLIREYDPDQTDPPPGTSNSAQNSIFITQPSLVTAFDGWGNPIRYVHPAFQGLVVLNPTASQADPVVLQTRLGPPPANRSFRITDIRRADSSFNIGAPFDADGGIPISNRPYFYSCGPDGDPTTTEDNIYLTKPRFVKK